MPNKCVVRGCRREGGFHFPSEPELSMKWRIAIKKEHWEPSIHSRVCRDHFNADDFRGTLGKRFLKKEAIPSVFPWSTDNFDPGSLNEVPHHESESNNQDDVKEDLSSENNLKEDSFRRQECLSESEVDPPAMPDFDTKEQGTNIPIDEASFDGFDDEDTPHNRLLDNEANVIEDMKKGNQNSMQPIPSPITPHPSFSDRPRLSYSSMIAEALNQAEKRMMPLEDIYIYISQRYPFYRMSEKNWQNAVRHNLSLNPSFYQVPRPMNSTGRGKLWTTNSLQNTTSKSRRVSYAKSVTSHCQKPSESVTALNEVKQAFLCRLCHSKLPSRSLWCSHYYECPR